MEFTDWEFIKNRLEGSSSWDDDTFGHGKLLMAVKTMANVANSNKLTGTASSDEFF